MTAKCIFTKPQGASPADMISDASPLPISTPDTEGDYETVAAGQTDQALGATGAAGDYLSGLTITPATTSPGVVSIKDGAGSSITIFPGGASSVPSLVPFFIKIGATSSAGAWSVTTGANISVVATGRFT